MKQQSFKTNPVKRILIYLFSIVVMFILTSIFLSGERFTNFYWTINIFTFIVCFLFIIFESDTTIICDEVGCTVRNKRFWQSSGKSYGFRWIEVTETDYYADTESNIIFYVEFNGIRKKIVMEHFSFDDVDCFIETVNWATPHIPYIWKKNDGLIASTFEGRGFSKVAR